MATISVVLSQEAVQPGMGWTEAAGNVQFGSLPIGPINSNFSVES